MSNAPRETRANARDRLAAERAAQAAAARRRENLVRWGLVIGVVVIVAAIAVGVVVTRSASSNDTSGATPAGVTDSMGFPTGAATAPVVNLWEDFQCPNCRDFEAANRAAIEAMATSGKAKIVYHTWAFLDRENVNNAKDTQDSSTRAAIAAACASDQGKFLSMHDTIFENQPATEGDGYTDAQLEDFAKQAGVADADQFAQCLSTRKYAGFVNRVGQAADQNQVTGTPTVQVDGTIVDLDGLPWAEAWQRVETAVDRA